MNIVVCTQYLQPFNDIILEIGKKNIKILCYTRRFESNSNILCNFAKHIMCIQLTLVLTIKMDSIR